MASKLGLGAVHIAAVCEKGYALDKRVSAGLRMTPTDFAVVSYSSAHGINTWFNCVLILLETLTQFTVGYAVCRPARLGR
jgi:hypothetical protein